LPMVSIVAKDDGVVALTSVFTKIWTNWNGGHAARVRPLAKQCQVLYAGHVADAAAVASIARREAFARGRVAYVFAATHDGACIPKFPELREKAVTAAEDMPGDAADEGRSGLTRRRVPMTAKVASLVLGQLSFSIIVHAGRERTPARARFYLPPPGERPRLRIEGRKVCLSSSNLLA